MSTSTSHAVGSRELYRQMAVIRSFEEAAYRAYEQGEVAGTIHASIGQEAVAAGVINALRGDDLVFTHHRGHGHALVKGVKPARLFAELFGRADGVSAGKGGSMHATDTSAGFLGSLAVVGGSIPLAVGVALAGRRLGKDVVAAVFFGDGAVNQGVLYESINLAAIWSLPVLFVCENNRYAISVSDDYATAGEGIVGRARSFGIKVEQVDGQDVTEVGATAQSLIAHARSEGPALIEALTYRLMGHSRGDPPGGLYRSDDEVEEWRKRDPLTVLARTAQIPDDECKPLLAEARTLVDSAIAAARAMPEPPPEATETEIWA